MGEATSMDACVYDCMYVDDSMHSGAPFAIYQKNVSVRDRQMIQPKAVRLRPRNRTAANLLMTIPGFLEVAV